MNKELSEKLAKKSLPLVLFLTLTNLFFPSWMPIEGLDPSWVVSMNEAIRYNFKIGKDIIFTFGPFASVYTNQFHPATNLLEIFGVILFSFCYCLVFSNLLKQTKAFYAYSIIVLISLLLIKDTLLLSYPLMVFLAVSQIIELHKTQEADLKNTLKTTNLIIAYFSCFGLLVLVKGSLLPFIAMVTLLCAIWFLIEKLFLFSIITTLTPTLFLAVFWKISGQDFSYLKDYFLNSFQIISGYTDAMSLTGNLIEILVFLILSVILLVKIFISSLYSIRSKFFLSSLLSLYLLITFKAGFVRHDGHGAISLSAVILSSLLVYFIIKKEESFQTKILDFFLAILCIISLSLFLRYCNYKPKDLIKSLYNSPKEFVQNLSYIYERTNDPKDIILEYEQSLTNITKKFYIPPVEGSSDIYPINQSALIASGNVWSPRPIFQSYSSYTEKLIKINADHLEGEKAPKNIFIQQFTIDNRYPASEDGPSFIKFLENYKVEKNYGDFLHLTKKASPEELIKKVILKSNFHFKEEVSLPSSDAIIFAKISFKKTLFGKILSIVLKPDIIELEAKFLDGSQSSFRIIPQMSEAGFIISPLLKTNSDLEKLFKQKYDFAISNRIKSMIIYQKGFGGISWLQKYDVELIEISKSKI